MKVEQGRVDRKAPDMWVRAIKELDEYLDLVWSKSLSRWCVVRKPIGEPAPGGAVGDNPKLAQNICVLVYQTPDGEYLELDGGILTMLKSMDRARNGDLRDLGQQIKDAHQARKIAQDKEFQDIRDEARRHFGAREAERVFYVIDKEKAYASKKSR